MKKVKVILRMVRNFKILALYRITVLYISMFFAFTLVGCEKIELSTVKVFYEQIPGSKNHEPNGTWWGYNQSKIVRYGNVVYMYVIENENIDNNPNPNASNPSRIVLYRKEGEGAWLKGASFNTSRPGNILIDSEGIVHLIVFEPTYTNASENGSFGRLKHYWFPNCRTGNITTFHEKIIVHNDGLSQGETVNIRVGASIGPNDLIAVSFGLRKNHIVCYKEKYEINWNQEVAGSNLGSDYYYPYVQVSGSGINILAVQDDWMGSNLPNIYQKSHFFEKRNGTWRHENIVDLQTHSLASTRPQLVDNSDIYEDATGNIILTYLKKLDPGNNQLSTFIQASRVGSVWNHLTITTSFDKTNWIRGLEMDGQMYYFCSSWDKLYIKKGLTGAYKRLDIPKMKGIYPYLAAPRGGTSRSADYIDVLLLCGHSGSYPNAKNYYVRIAKSELREL